ncbi:MAG: family 20 glycosylhydrolase [Verrucomicrobiae bacterium]|nr:family 20 glycosylhydrolase [Verrucomicrobiae bacterium]
MKTMNNYRPTVLSGNWSWRIGVMLLVVLGCLSCWTATVTAATSAEPSSTTLPIRGLHLSAPGKQATPLLVKFIREELPKQGVNTLILEIGYQYDYTSLPEFADPSAMGEAELKQVLRACRENGIELIPQINCLGHQSWAKYNGRLLDKHPEFDETPGKYPENKGIYCRSYCPLHPQVHEVVFALMDELIKVCEAKSFHVGMDEVFILADPDCPRCQGKDPAQLFADEVNRLHAHLKTLGCRTWIWGDRFLDGKATKLGKWEASENGTAAALDLVPKDLLICDWHYEAPAPTAKWFAEKGFDVVTCPWRRPKVALEQLTQMRALRADPKLAQHALGLVQTTWCGVPEFVNAYQVVQAGAFREKDRGADSAQCFVTLFEAMRKK